MDNIVYTLVVSLTNRRSWNQLVHMFGFFFMPTVSYVSWVWDARPCGGETTWDTWGQFQFFITSTHTIHRHTVSHRRFAHFRAHPKTSFRVTNAHTHTEHTHTHDTHILTESRNYLSLKLKASQGEHMLKTYKLEIWSLLRFEPMVLFHAPVEFAYRVYSFFRWLFGTQT